MRESAERTIAYSPDPEKIRTGTIWLEHFRRIAPLLGLLMLGAALWTLHRFLREYHLQDLLRELQGIPAGRLGAAAALTFLSYLVLTLYDYLALDYVGRPMPYGAVARTSFITYAFSHNLGLSMLAGGSVRMRLYSAYGLGAMEIAQVTGFAMAMFWSGYALLAGWALVASPGRDPWLPAWPPWAYRSLGIAASACAAGFFAAPLLRKRPLRFGAWQWPMPSLRLTLQMAAVSSLDWVIAAGVLYALIPAEAALTFLPFLVAFLLAQLAGMVSQVPGGVGVFESGMLLVLGSAMPASRAAGVLIAYRVIYYLVPFLLSVVLLGGYELAQRREQARKAAGAIGQWLPRFVPPMASLAVFLGGAIMLFSGALPSDPAHLDRLAKVLPLGMIEFSHFGASVAGAALLVLGQGIWRRVSSAHALACGLLIMGIAASLFKGFHWGQAGGLAVVLALLYASRREFFRKAALTQEPFSLEWTVMIAAVLICTLWLGFFTHKHVPYSDDLWWRFSLHGGGASRFLRAVLGATATVLLFSAYRLLRPVAPEPVPAGPQELDRVVRVVAGCPRTYANLAYLGDKTFFWSKSESAFLMYAVEGRSWVVMGDPVGPEEAWPELVWDFKDFCDRHGGYAAFYQVAPEHLHVFADAGFSFLKLGEEAMVPLAGFALEGGAYKNFRQVVNKLQKEGVRFDILAPEAAAGSMPELKKVSDAWLAGKKTREKGFSIGRFDPDYLRRFPIALVRQNGTAVAFANLWLGADREELSMDMMRYAPEAPHGIMDYLFAQVMAWGKEQGWQKFNLGMAPLSGLAYRASSPLWNKVGGTVFRHGEHFYNFQGLRQYKEKFKPEWEPRYLAAQGGLTLPMVLLNVSTLISGGLRGVLAK